MSVALFAVHVGDVLSWPAVVAGFVLAALLAGLGAWKVREHEIPRIALLTAAFFVASSIHVKFGLSSVHLLLTGLVGVVLRTRAPLAILVGVTLQALLVSHGGISAIGVNTCTEAIPALMAAGLFWLFGRVGERHAWFRCLLVGVAALIWGWCLLFAVGLLVGVGANWSAAIDWSSSAGVLVSLDFALAYALAFALHPLALLGLSAFAAACVAVEVSRPGPAGFARGALVGMLAVLLTAALAGTVVMFGTDDKIESREVWAAALFLPHVPLALVEGLIVGSIVAFVWRVKPEMLGKTSPLVRAAVAVVVLLGATASPAQAHGLVVERVIDRGKREVTISCKFEGDGAPKDATVTVRDEDSNVISEGKLDAEGRYAFRYDRPQQLLVFVRTYGPPEERGHTQTEVISAAELAGEVASPRSSRLRDLLTGVTLLLAAAAFVMAWRNSVRLSRLEAARNAPPPEAVAPKSGDLAGG